MDWLFRFLILLDVILVAFHVCVSSQEVFSCGGFVKSTVQIPFSKVMVKLYTRDMHLKYETDCAPNNGYYMIPVYAKGSYVIKVHPPPGWHFEPPQVDLTVDGVEDACTMGVDMNFNFLGYSVSGGVLSKGSNAGPTDFAIALTKEGGKEPLLVTKTLAGGNYEFQGVLPGNYYITNVDSSMCIGKAQTTIPVEVTGPTVAPPLEINGYSIQGSIKDDTQPVGGAQMLLYSETVVKLSDCDSTPLKEFTVPPAAAGMNFVCRKPSSANGEYKFSCVPSGSYMLVPYYTNSGVMFDLSPKVSKINVGHSAVTVEEPFQVIGFSVPGRVLWQEKGQGVHGVEIFVNGKFTSQTNQNGDYLLERMSPGKYKITAKRDGMEFTAVDVELSPKNHQIPDIIATTFQICGKVVVNSFPSSIPKLTQRKLLLTDLETREVLSLTTDRDGAFCKMVQRGAYLLEPQILPNEKQAGVVLVPKERKITVTDKPLDGINFTQFEAKLAGHINCIGTCRQLKIQLLTGTHEEVSSIHFPSIKKKETFHFTHLLPGAYTVKLLADSYCWEVQELNVNVEDSDITDLQFRQSGFVFSVVSSHKTKLIYSLVGASSVSKTTVDLHPGKNSFCLPEAGTYEMNMESCHRFEPSSLKHNTDNGEVVNVNAVEHSVTGTVVTDSELGDIYVSVNDQKGSLVKKIGPLSVASNDTGQWTYTFEYWAKSGDEITLEPTSGSYLFSPENHRLKVGNECLLDTVKFVGSKGLFMECRIEPVLRNVKITMKHNNSEDVVMEATTNEKGECGLGPLRSFDGYTVSASMQGYSFEPISGQLCRFKALKLSELLIKALDTSKVPLQGVLISLSGTEYRSNNLTDDTGSMAFFGLSPGEYFLRPVLKEFSFQPATHLVKIAEGSSEVIEVIGNRVAYSCSGTLRYLAGQPVPGAVLEAVSSGCQHVQEEATTTEEGAFRIRGLHPGCEYNLRVKEGQDLPSTFPRQLTIKVKEEDITDVALVLRPHLSTMDIAGLVECDRDLLSSLRVALFKGDSPSPLHSVHLQGSVFFLPSVNLDNTTYTARLESTLNPSEYNNLASPEITFKANNTSKFLTFEFKPKKKSPEAEISKSSYIALPIAVILVLLAYNYEKVFPIVREWTTEVMAFVNFQQQHQGNKMNPMSGSAVDSGGNEVVEGTGEGQKKKTRARKT